MRRSIEDAGYLDVLLHLRAGLRSGERATFELDFWPTAPYAQRFIREMQKRLTADLDSSEYAEGLRGLNVVMAILGGHRARPGRPSGAPLDPALTNRLQFVRDAYLSRLRVKYYDRSSLRRRIDETVQFDLTDSERRVLARLLAKTPIKIGEIANHLAAWHCRVPLRRVREALRTAEQDSAIIYA